MKIPSATYRIQFNPSFTFKDLKKILPYLAGLGISHIYASPIFKPRKGSEHGYDVVDPTQLNAELGTESEFDELIAAMKNLKMEWIQDVVPNHVAYHSGNTMLMDVLENGPNSEFYHFFDVDWEHPYVANQAKILAPFLGKFYGECLENGEIQLVYNGDGLQIQYYHLIFPLRLESYIQFFTHELERLTSKMGSNHPDYVKFLGVLYSLKNISDGSEFIERKEQARFVKKMLWELYTGNDFIKSFVEDNLRIFNGKIDNPASYNLLDDLLGNQYFRLSLWKVGTEEINYRRFFTVNDLISLRMEDERVFNYTHRLVNRLIREGKISGLRIDHVDGLYDPAEYLQRLRSAAGEIYLVVEKILEYTEELPADWPVEGTTGYNFLNFVNGIFCERENALVFEKIYYKFSDFRVTYPSLIHEKKRLIVGKHMAGDIDNLAHLLSRISGQYRYGRDFTLYGLRRALVEVLAWFPVYRTYISRSRFREEDRNYISEAVKKAKKTMPDFVGEIDFIRKVLHLEFESHLSEDEKELWFHFIMRFQQTSGPLMAKGFEDTALYIYNRLLSLNEVGGNPAKFGFSDIEFHHFNKKRISHWPHAMNTTSTHDTKRGEDVRARLNVLSEIPMEWERNLIQWHKMNQEKKKVVNDLEVPDKNDEYFLYQTLIGIFPFHTKPDDELLNRIKAYIVKAVREAKVRTAWLQPDQEYENGFTEFVDKIFDDQRDGSFYKEFLNFQKKIAYYGVFNTLSQILLKMTAPGLPDFYQGSELFDLNLVDPDNRRPVDYSKRASLLQKITKQADKDILKLINELLADLQNGRIKMFLIYKILNILKKFAKIFQYGSYTPLEINGKFKNQVFGFIREYRGDYAVTAVPRLLTGMIEEGQVPLGTDIWNDTSIVLPGKSNRWMNVISDQEFTVTGQDYSVGALFRHFPGVLLINQQ